MIFIDTNYFLRFLLKDVKKQYLQVKQLMLDGAQGKLKLLTSTVVFFEIYWVLSSYYGRNKLQLVEILGQILDLEFIQLEERSTLQEALKLFNSRNLSLEDCYNLAFAVSKKAIDFKTFDTKLNKVFKEKS